VGVGWGALAAAVVVLASGAARAQEPLTPREDLRFYDAGPLRIREQFLPTVGFLALEPTNTEVVGRGHWQIDLIQTTTNTWASSKAFEGLLDARPQRTPITLAELQSVDGPGGVYYVDGELDRTTLSLRTGIGGGFELQLSVPVVDFGGGVGDGFIEGFHDAFGFPESHRPAVPRDTFTVYIRDAEGNEVFRSLPSRAALSDATVAIKHTIPTGSRRWLVAVQVVGKLATGEEGDLYGSGSRDFGGQVMFARYNDHSQVHLALGAVRLGESKTFGLPAQTRFAALLAYEHQLTRHSSVILQGQATESPFRELKIQDLGDTAYLFDLGLKLGLGRSTVLFLALSENVLNFDSSADVGAHIGLTWTH
jgi:hypothetical protein